MGDTPATAFRSFLAAILAVTISLYAVSCGGQGGGEDQESQQERQSENGEDEDQGGGY